MKFLYLPGLGLTEGQLAAFREYSDFLLNWNAKVNLTAITEPKEVEIKHFLDSLLLERCCFWRECFDGEARQPRVADVGGGAGFPGIPLKIAHDSIALDSIEASGKKVEFLHALADALALRDTEAFHFRAEEAGQNPAYRGKYDWALSRGVAPIPVLLEYCLPLIKTGGFLAAYKGPAGQEEAMAGNKAAALLGGELVDVVSATLPEGQGERRIFIYKKTKPTPEKYPRRPGMPSKQPLI